MPKGKSRRNIGKRKWRTLKATNVVKEVYMQQAKEKLNEMSINPSKKLKVGPVESLFTIDTTADSRKPLDKDRFKKRIVEPLSKLDTKKVDLLLKRAKVNPEVLEGKPEQKKEEVFDLWGDSAPKPLRPKPVGRKLRKEIEVPTIIPPHAGQSINPSLGSQKELMELVVQQTELRKGKYGNKKVKINNKRKNRTRIKTKKQAEHFKRMREQKEKKEREKHERLAGKYMHDFQKRMEEKPKILEARKKVQESIKEKIKSGLILPTKRKIGKRRYQARALDFKELDEVDPKLANAGANQEALRDQFDGIYRRGLLEPFKAKKARKRGNLPAFKYHTNPNLTWKEREKGIQKFPGITRGSNKASFVN